MLLLFNFLLISELFQLYSREMIRQNYRKAFYKIELNLFLRGLTAIQMQVAPSPHQIQVSALFKVKPALVHCEAESNTKHTDLCA